MRCSNLGDIRQSFGQAPEKAVQAVCREASCILSTGVCPSQILGSHPKVQKVLLTGLKLDV